MDEVATIPLLRWIVLFPLLGAVGHLLSAGLLRTPPSRRLVVWTATASVVLSLACVAVSLAALIRLPGPGGILIDVAYTWIGAGLGSSAFSADLALQFDALSAVMALLVTVLGIAIHLFAARYMDADERDDREVQRLFGQLDLLVAAMLLLVLADNLLLLFAGWQATALASSLAIGFRYTDGAKADAGTKAFVVGRVGDFGFVVGVLLLFWALAEAGSPTVSFRGIEAAFPSIAHGALPVPGAPDRTLPLVDVVAACFLIAACAKSAQFPLQSWLPDATAGPIPATALIQTVTTVAAGVYLVCRLSFLYAAAPTASALLAWIGGSTALLAAFAATAQRDVPRLLAYATMSQLGFMFVAAGCGAFTVAMFHLVTSSLFATSYFLGMGIVIVSLGRERDLARMGALRRRLPLTRTIVLFAVLALGAVPPFSGFFSKEEILVAARAAEVPGHEALFWTGIAAALLTSFGAFRLFFLVFAGPSNVRREVRARLQDPDNGVLGPIYVLTVLVVVAGALGPSQFWGDMVQIEHSDSLGNFLQGAVVASPYRVSTNKQWAVVGALTAASVLGIAGAWTLYVRRDDWLDRLARLVERPATWLRDGDGVDAAYRRAVLQPLSTFGDRFLTRVVENGALDGVAVDGGGRALRALANDVLKRLQSGMTQAYLVAMVAGSLGVLLYLVYRP